MTSDFILQFQYTIYRSQSQAFSALYTKKLFTAAQLDENSSFAARLQ